MLPQDRSLQALADELIEADQGNTILQLKAALSAKARPGPTCAACMGGEGGCPCLPAGLALPPAGRGGGRRRSWS